MSEAKRVKLVPRLSANERKRIFDKVYREFDSPLDAEDELFKKDSNELSKSDSENYTIYFSALKQAENEAETAQYKAEMAKNLAEMAQYKAELVKKEKAEAKLASMVGKRKFPYSLLTKVCDELGPLLFDIADKEQDLTDEKKIEIAEKIQLILADNPQKCKILLVSLKLDQFVWHEINVPRNSNDLPYAPSSMRGHLQVTNSGNERKDCLVYPFPFCIAHFPVFFCHPMFSDFMDILHCRNPNNPIFINFQEFMKEQLYVRGLDECIASLISIVLDSDISKKKNEEEFVSNVAKALQQLFPRDSVKTNFKVKSDDASIHYKTEMDAAVLINDFPFIIVEAKNCNYSINTALQGFQYYGIITSSSSIDNDPGFLLTLDKGIMYLYGMARVNSRVVCTCLLSLEFTNYHFNIEDFTGTLYRCLSGLYFFYDQFKKRISNGLNQDAQHQVYLKLKNSPKNVINPKPLPAIFSVQSASDPSSRIEIKSFVNVIRRTADGVEMSYVYFKPCVYLVKISIGTTEMDAVLKISYNYDIETHKKLNEHGFAPTIFGYEKMFGRWHVMLMEYFDNTTYDSLFSHVRENKKKEIKLDCDTITRSLEEILGKLEELQLVHGDFRSSNILAKRSATNPAVLEDFKLVDFELSGKVNENYPFLALRNREVDWHKDVNSYTPRQFSHDRHLFMDMCAKELEIDNVIN